MTAFVEDLTASEARGSPSSLDKRGLDISSYSPIVNKSHTVNGGSADRYERINTFGGSPQGGDPSKSLGL
jgi:hypothetical protein